MSFIDKAIIKTALATQPHLRHNLRSVFQSIGSGPLDEARLDAIEAELVDPNLKQGVASPDAA